MLKSQDVMIILKIVSMGPREWKYSEVALELHMSPSEVHAGVKRLKNCALLTELSLGVGGIEQKLHIPDIDCLKEFIQSGIRYVFPAIYSQPAKGLPTSYGVEHLFEGFNFTGGFIPVWELDVGEYTGAALKPLYSSAPKAAMDDFRLYELLALADAMRTDDDKLRDFAWEKMNVMLGGSYG